MSIGIGATLREAREEQGRSLEEAASQLRTRASQLAALEEERFDDFGGEVYAKGFLRNYALELGLDPDPLLDLYRREVGHDQGAGVAVPARVSTPRAPRSSPPAWMAWVLVAVVVLAGVAFLGTLDDSRTPDQASPTEPEGPPPAPADPDGEEPGSDQDAEDAPTGAEPGDGDAEDPDGQDGGQEPDAPDTGDADPDGAGEGGDDGNGGEGSGDGSDDEATEEEVDGVDLLLALEADSWMRVIVDGSLVLEQTVPAGETLPFEAEQEIEIRYGNAGGVRANLNGEDLGAQGTSGEAVTLRYTPDGPEET